MSTEWKRGTFTYDAVGLGHTSTNALSAWISFLTQAGWSLASYSTATNKYFLRTDRASDTYWQFNGDGPTQHCGLAVVYNSANTRLEISAFLENQAATGLQKISNTAHTAYVTLDSTAPNNWLFVGGEYGIYFESGRDGLPTNLAQLMVVTWETIPEFNGTDDARLRWTTMGAVCDLFGNLKFTSNRNLRFVDNVGANKNYTGGLQPFVCRGTNTFSTSTQADDRTIGLGSRDNFFGMAIATAGLITEGRYTFGLLNTPRDGRYRISPLMVDQIPGNYIACGINSSSASNNVASDGQVTMYDVRQYRQVRKFVAVDSSLIPFVNITDLANGNVYRIAQVADGGRNFNLGVRWPDVTDVVTVTG